MKNSIKVLVMLAIIAMAGMANAQTSASTTGNINATVIVPITITKNHDMDLGKIVSDPTGGFMSIASDGTRSFTNSANKLASNPHGTAAEFTVTGDASCTFSTVHTGVGTAGSVNGAFLFSGANSMWFVMDATGSQSLAGGAVDYKVTGTVTIGALQAAGSYAGSFTELVAYE